MCTIEERCLISFTILQHRLCEHKKTLHKSTHFQGKLWHVFTILEKTYHAMISLNFSKMHNWVHILPIDCFIGNPNSSMMGNANTWGFLKLQSFNSLCKTIQLHSLHMYYLKMFMFLSYGLKHHPIMIYHHFKLLLTCGKADKHVYSIIQSHQTHNRSHISMG